MSRQFEIEWPDFNVTVTVDLLDENPQICDDLWQALPINAILMATASAGELFKVPIPFTPSLVPEEKLEFLPDEPVGSVTSTDGAYLLMKYGTVVEPLRVPSIGIIREGELEKLRSLATKLRDAFLFTKEITVATLRRKKQSAR